jgi:Flp pilus assembly protein TadG
MLRHRARRRDRTNGQALVEFSLVMIPFLILMMAVFDLGRAIYMMNTTAEAAREIARVTAVHPWNATKNLGTSSESASVIAAQRGLLPGMQFTPDTDIVCVDISDAVKADAQCSLTGSFVRVRMRSTFSPITPLVSMFGSHTLEAYSRIEAVSKVDP